jgi:hypothetical protein
MNADRIAQETVQIRYGGEPVGSGFRFIEDDIIVTNAHVFPPEIDDEIRIEAVVSGSELGVQLLDRSAEHEAGGHDYALLETQNEFPAGTEPLQPSSDAPSRGDGVWFAGHPFDIAETLVHTATVSGPHAHGFYLDGGVNLGNSGGPIAGAETGDVVGIVTESRMYRSQPLEDIINDLDRIQQQLLQIQEVHETTINRVDVEALAIETMQELQDAIHILSENSTSGIGVGYSIAPVVERLDKM